MPEKLERELKAEAKKKGFSGKRKNAYIYGTMRKTGWVPSTQRKSSKHHELKRKLVKARAR